MVLSKGRVLAPVFFLWSLSLLCAQSPGAAVASADPVSLVGITLNELIGSFGAPRSVYSARGLEEWQDDVVFVYDQGEFYIHKDRVWQLCIKAARGIKAGDTRGVVSMVLGPNAGSRSDSLFFSIDEKSWPLMLRCVFDKEDRLLMIFIYRSDL